MRRPLLLALSMLAMLAAGGEAQAATCSFTGVGGVGIWHLDGNWSCGHIPTIGDSAIVDFGDNVTVDQDDSVPSLTQNSGTITFSGSSTLQVTVATALNNGTVTGPGTLRAASGTFTKSAGSLTVQSGARLVLDAPASIDAGNICLMDLGGGDPQLQVGAALTIGAGAAAAAISCNAGLDGPAVKVGAAGSLIKSTAGTTTIDPGIDNDGVLSVQAGTLKLSGADDATSSGDYQIASGATLELNNSQGLTGAASVSGLGTLLVTGGSSSVAAGATFSPANLTLQSGLGTLALAGTTPTYAPATLNLTAGTLSSTRNVAPDALNAASGTLSGDFTTTIGAGQTLVKTAGALTVRNLARLVLDVPTSIDAGNICLMDQGGGDPELQVNDELTIGAGADAAAIGCNAGLDGDSIKIGPAGSLSRSAPGATDIGPGVEAAGELSVAAGQTLKLARGFRQTGGTVAVAAGGTLSGGVASTVSGGQLQVNGAYGGSPTLTGSGVLTGSGTVAGTVTNSSGTVRPGSSPGTLTISGPFTQGADGTLEVDIAGTTPGTQFDVLAVSGHASLDGTVEVQGGFDPQLADVFPFLTSGSRSGTFAAVTSAPLGGGKQYALDYPSGAPFGARLVLQPPPQPQNTSPPSVVGTPAVGQLVTCDPGAWTGSPAFAFQWLRDGQPIGGATSAVYTIIGDDAGHQIACRVAGTNAAGGAQATSALVAVPPPATNTPPPGATTTTAKPAEEVLAAETKDQVATALGLPPAKKCVSRRRFMIRVRRPPGVEIKAAKVVVNGKRVRTRKVAGRFTATVDLRGLPKGRFSVGITITTPSGLRITGARRYRTCAPKRR